MPRRHHIPQYRLHKQSGQAVVTLPDGLGKRRDVLLGKYQSPESRLEYARVLAEWEANGRRPPQPAAGPPTDTTINELLLDYWRWAERHYGNPSGELDNIRLALRPLKRLYGHTPARHFGPLALRALQDDMARSGLCRNQVNARINRVRRFFKWAVSFERLPATAHQGLKDVPGLQRGRSEARESEPVAPVPVEVVEATLAFMPAPVAAMTRLQLLSGCRPGEVMSMRAADLKTSGPVWEYRPASHKNKHRGLDRVIHLGTRAQEVIKPFLTTNLEAYLFSPRAYVEAMHRQRAERRKTKRPPSQLSRKRKPKPKRVPAERYNRRSYYVAVVRAVAKANRERAQQGLPPLPRWSPLQLRHTAATVIRSKYGVEDARVVLGHSKVQTTQIYAERDLTRAEQIAAEIG